MKQKWKELSWPLHKHNYLVLKLAVSILLAGLGYRFLSSRSIEFSNVSKNPLLEKTVNRIIPPPPVDSPGNRNQIPHKEKCDLFTGDWVPNPAGPVYTNESCDLIDIRQNCMKNGRPDTGYPYWRWSPRDCQLPQFDAKRFLELMRNKAWGLIGDSLSRNHVQSLICMLSKGITRGGKNATQPANTIQSTRIFSGFEWDLSEFGQEYLVRFHMINEPHCKWSANNYTTLSILVYHDEEFKSRRWLFSSYNFTISVIWYPFLAKAAIFEDNDGVSSSEIKLHIDILDSNWTDQYHSLDYIIFSTGTWFIKTAIYYSNDSILGCHYCPGKNLTELGFDFAYHKILNNIFNFIITSNHKGTVFYRTATQDHFENGKLFTGGSCRRTEPVKEGEFELNEMYKILRDIDLMEFDKIAAKASEKGVNFKLLDVASLSLLRPDGHPGPYGHFHPFAKDKSEKIVHDCLHWCLPGPTDSWNDLLMEMVVND